MKPFIGFTADDAQLHPQRIQVCGEVSNLVLFLASEMSSYSTGGAFVSDGIIAT